MQNWGKLLRKTKKITIVSVNVFNVYNKFEKFKSKNFKFEKFTLKNLNWLCLHNLPPVGALTVMYFQI